MQPRLHRVALTSAALLAAGASLTAADTTTTPDPTTTWGEWEGWGVSLAWWAAAFGTRADLADMLFSLDRTSYNGGAPVPGLGLTIARYNAGACSWNRVDGEAMVVSPEMMPSRQIEGYWLDPSSADVSSPAWNWTADAAQRAMLAAAAARGADTFELFSNSPMWWACANRNPAGSDDGASDNLPPDRYRAHAAYLAAVAARARDAWGVAFRSVEAFNEPSADWWTGTSGTQEGCHVSAGAQAEVLAALRSELDARGLGDTRIAASDETSYEVAAATWDTLLSSSSPATAANATTTGYVDRINVHGYGGGAGRGALHAAARAAARPLWNSEYGGADAAGAQLAAALLADLRELHPAAWVYWQAVDGGGWGLVDGDNEAGTLGAVEQKFYVLAQFTRHLRPGMTVLDGGADNVAAAYDADAQKLVLVAVNWDEAQYLNFELGEFSAAGSDGDLVPRWSTMIGSGEQYVAYNDTYMSGTKFWSYFETNQTQTFEISGVSL
ncbi:endo-beta-1,6-galactanase [Xylariomycetidae sp. FL0641]|nr:endo-beta-1,6-galactanase [Xylariomycetidae sp. FL0641]